MTDGGSARQLAACAGAGRRVGETCEQLWAQLKPLTSVTRYMAKPNYLDCIDDFLRFVAAARLAEFVPFMVEQHRSLVRKLGKWQQGFQITSPRCGCCVAAGG